MVDERPDRRPDPRGPAGRDPRRDRRGRVLRHADLRAGADREACSSGASRPRGRGATRRRTGTTSSSRSSASSRQHAPRQSRVSAETARRRLPDRRTGDEAGSASRQQVAEAAQSFRSRRGLPIALGVNARVRRRRLRARARRRQLPERRRLAAAARTVGRRRRARPACTAAPRSARATTSPSSRTLLLRGRCRDCQRADRLALPGGRARDGACLSPPACVDFGLSLRALAACGLLRRARHDLGDRHRAADRPEPDRAAGGRGRARAPARVAAELRVARGRPRRGALPLPGRARLPRAAWAWAT